MSSFHFSFDRPTDEHKFAFLELLMEQKIAHRAISVDPITPWLEFLGLLSEPKNKSATVCKRLSEDRP